MSYFNDDQRDYMRMLARRDHADLCWCAWYPRDQCPHCPRDVSLVDRLRIACPGCDSHPPPDSARPITHRIGCERSRDAQAITLGLVDLGGEA